MRYLEQLIQKEYAAKRKTHTNLAAKYGSRLCIETDLAYYDTDPYSAYADSCSDPMYYLVVGKKGVIRNGPTPGRLLLCLYPGYPNLKVLKKLLRHNSVDRADTQVNQATGEARIHFYENAFEEMLAFIKPYPTTRTKVSIDSGRLAAPEPFTLRKSVPVATN